MDQHAHLVGSIENPVLSWQVKEKQSFWENHKISVVRDTSDVKFDCIQFKSGYASILMNLYRSIKLRTHSYSRIQAGNKEVYIRSRLAAAIAAVELLEVKKTQVSLGASTIVEGQGSNTIEEPNISTMVSNINKIHERVKSLLKDQFLGVSHSSSDEKSDASSDLERDVYIGNVGKEWKAEKVTESKKGGEAEVFLTNSLAVRWKNEIGLQVSPEQFNKNVEKEEKILAFLGRSKKGRLVQIFDIAKGGFVNEAIPYKVFVDKRYTSDCTSPILSKGDQKTTDIQKMAKCMIEELSILISHGIYPTDLRLANMSYHQDSHNLLQLEDLGGSVMDSELDSYPKGFIYSSYLKDAGFIEALRSCNNKKDRIKILKCMVLFLAGRALFDLALVNSTTEQKQKIEDIPVDFLVNNNELNESKERPNEFLREFYNELQAALIVALLESPHKYNILQLQLTFGVF
ncbi:MAG: hypothetical protein JSS09_01855 [Verrucomicrobia bacterium]|nr:hypothetical protein [Verrucomicrobiota bacterium]